MHKRYIQKAFTIVELLIVIVIIAILATIVIAAYNGIQDRAHNTAVQSDLRNIGQRTRMAITLDDSERPPAATQAGLEDVVKFSKDSYNTRNTISVAYCRDDTRFSYIVSAKTGKTYVYNSWEGYVKEGGTWGGGNLGNTCVNTNTVGTGNGYAAGAPTNGAWISLKGDGTSPSWLSWVK